MYSGRALALVGRRYLLDARRRNIMGEWVETLEWRLNLEATCELYAGCVAVVGDMVPKENMS